MAGKYIETTKVGLLTEHSGSSDKESGDQN